MMLGGNFMGDDGMLTMDIWEDDIGRPMLKDDPRAIRIKIHAGEPVPPGLVARMQREYYHPGTTYPHFPGEQP